MLTEQLQHCKHASKQLARLSTTAKNQLLQDFANAIRLHAAEIQLANDRDIEFAMQTGLSTAMIDRLRLDATRIEAMAKAAEQIAQQPDPVGAITETRILANGIQLQKQRLPLGVILMIYEARPNVTLEAAALALKSGNAIILRGGKEARHSNLAIINALYSALSASHPAHNALRFIDDPERALLPQLLSANQYIDLVIPRGGEALIRYVTDNAKMPVIQHFKGVCHLYVEQSAQQPQALAILKDGKTTRPAVCNALETLLVDQAIAAEFLPKVANLLSAHNVLAHCCAQSLPYFPSGTLATEQDFHAEYLALEIAVKVVDDFAAAIAHIDQYGSNHTEVIVSENISRCREFVHLVDASVVSVNVSSRFSDGGELGLGAEIGISTSKLHAYGPMGAWSLTTEKFVLIGSGQVRH